HDLAELGRQHEAVLVALKRKALSAVTMWLRRGHSTQSPQGLQCSKRSLPCPAAQRRGRLALDASTARTTIPMGYRLTAGEADLKGKSGDFVGNSGFHIKIS